MTDSLPSDIKSPTYQWQLFTIGLMVNDFFMLGLAFRLAYWIRFENSFSFFRQEAFSDFNFYIGIVLVLIPCWMIIFAFSGLYQRRNLLGGIQEYSLVFRGTATGILVVIIIGFLEPAFIIARGWLFLSWLLVFFLTAFGRFWIRRLVYTLRQRGYFLAAALIVGANDEGKSLAQQLLGWRTSGLNVVGMVDDKLETGAKIGKNLEILGTIAMLDEIIAEHNVEELILAHSALSRAEVIAIFKDYGFHKKLNLRLSSGLFELITTGLEVKEFAYVPLVQIHKVRLKGIDLIIKSSLDIGLAIPLILCLSPLMLLIAIAIKLDSPGPVFYRRRVMGLNGRQFDAIKFRTMLVNGDELLAARPDLQERLRKTHKLKQDPRITRLGSFLRSSSLDELPQLLNVLKYEMSLVGPRMISPPEMEMYNHWALNLLTVRPGLSGLWQVSGRSDISYETRVQLDMYYIRNWTLWLDLHILLRTLPAIIKQKGAY